MWTDAQRRKRRADYALNEAAIVPREVATVVIVPDDVGRIDGDGSSCFNCGVRDGCRHRPWMLAR